MVVRRRVTNGVSHRSHYWVGWGWSSRFRPFANVKGRSWRCRFWAFPNSWNAVFRWISSVRRKANRFQAFSTVASVDRKWSSRAVPGEIDWADLNQSQSIDKSRHREWHRRRIWFVHWNVWHTRIGRHRNVDIGHNNMQPTAFNI